jgi:biopolymer transport protein ExbB
MSKSDRRSLFSHAAAAAIVAATLGCFAAAAEDEITPPPDPQSETMPPADPQPEPDPAGEKTEPPAPADEKPEPTPLVRAQTEPLPTELPIPPAPRTVTPILTGSGTAWEIFQRGGWCMWPILVCAILGLAFFIERMVDLRWLRHAPGEVDKDVVHVVDTRGVDSGLAVCLERQSSLTRVLYAALLRYGSPRQELEVAVADECSRLIYDMRRNCRWILFFALLAPLFGALGTVLGLIHSFDAVAAGTAPDKLEQLASGAGVALLSGAWGLLVAIPLLAAYFITKIRAEDIVRGISERAIDAIITLDRKARRSIRLIDDLEEQLDTQEMAAPRTPTPSPPNLEMEFSDSDDKSPVKSSVATPAQLPIVVLDEPAKRASTHGDMKAVPQPAPKLPANAEKADAPKAE